MVPLHNFSLVERVWRAAGLTGQVRASHRNRGEHWFRDLLSSNEVKTTQLILMLCDALWLQRNQCTFTDISLEEEYIAVSVSSNFHLFQRANSWPERTSEDLSETSLLRPPPVGIRISFDTGIREGRAGVAALAIDGDGNFLCSTTDIIHGVTDPVYAEGKALEVSISLAADLGMENATLVGDCLKIVQMVRELEPPSVSCTELVNSLKDSLEEIKLGSHVGFREITMR